MKRILIYSLIQLTLIGIIIFLIHDMFTSITNLREEYNTYVGTHYIMAKDTLTVIDYSVFSETFTLSNGIEINYKLILKDSVK